MITSLRFNSPFFRFGLRLPSRSLRHDRWMSFNPRQMLLVLPSLYQGPMARVQARPQARPDTRHFPTSRHSQSDRYFSFHRRFDEASMRLQDGAKGFRRFVFRLRLRSLLAAKLPRLPRWRHLRVEDLPRWQSLELCGEDLLWENASMPPSNRLFWYVICLFY